jgi:hypothetical protein
LKRTYKAHWGDNETHVQFWYEFQQTMSKNEENFRLQEQEKRKREHEPVINCSWRIGKDEGTLVGSSVNIILVTCPL